MTDHLQEPLLHEYLDGELTEADAALVTSHLADCAHCRRQLAELQALFSRLHALPERPLTTDLAPEVLAALPPTARPLTAPWLRWLLPLQLLATAAILLALWPLMESRMAILQLSPATLIDEITALVTLLPGWLAQTAVWPTLPTFQLNLPALEWALLLGVGALLWLIGNSLLLKPRLPKFGE